MSYLRLPYFLALFAVLLQMTTAGTIAPSLSGARSLFAADLFRAITADRTQQNVVYSPASIQSCLALASFGAAGETAKELRQGLKLGDGESETIARNYGDFVKSAFRTTGDGPQLTMANRIYVNEGLQIAPAFEKVAADYFGSQAEKVRFADAPQAVQKINAWVEQQTKDKIKDLMSADAVNSETSAVLVNAIYFKAFWASPFSEGSTHKSKFSIDTRQQVEVDMMLLDESLKYVELPDLDATAIELPYKNSDLSMMVLLPRKVDGLGQLEQKLASVDLNEIASGMKIQDVDVFLPKFKIEFDIDLKEPMKKLGMSTMFSERADFSGLFTNTTPQRISAVRHKAFLSVNEAGSEAAAATFLKIVPMSLNLNKKVFNANHPFVFAIRSPQAVYFAGHVTKF